MKKFMRRIHKKSIGLLAAIGLLLPIVAVAATPVFDTVNLYKVANLSNSADWLTQTTAKPGETLTFRLHVHNEVSNTKATGVKVSATLPNQAVNSFTSTGTVSADNAVSVLANVKFDLSEKSKVEYVAGSTKMYNHSNQLVSVLPDGVTNGGVAIGKDVYGCWDYELWIYFKAKVVAVEEPKEKLCSITVKKYEDINGNGQYDEGETWLPNWQIRLDSDGFHKEYLTDGNGIVVFRNLSEGTYTASEVMQKGWINTTPEEVIVTCSEGHDGYVEFGNKKIFEPVIAEETTVPESTKLPASGPLEAVAGTLATIGMGSAGYVYQRSRSRASKILKYKKF